MVCGTHEDLKNTQQINSRKDLKTDLPHKDSNPNSFQKSERYFVNKCIFCNLNHAPQDCTKFQTLIEYHRCLLRKNACFNCTQIGHKSFACPKLKSCTLCNDPRKHFQLLCRNNFNLF